MEKSKSSHLETLVDSVGAEAIHHVDVITQFRTMPDSPERYKRAKVAVSVISAYARLRRAAAEA